MQKCKIANFKQKEVFEMARKGNAPAGDGSTADRGTAPVTFSIKLPQCQYCSAPSHPPPHPH